MLLFHSRGGVLHCAVPHCSFQLSSECPARCRVPARAAALPLPTADPFPRCSLPLTGIREMFFFSFLSGTSLPHSRLLSVDSGEKLFLLTANLCFLLLPGCFPCLPWSACQGLMVRGDGRQVQAHNCLA